MSASPYLGWIRSPKGMTWGWLYSHKKEHDLKPIAVHDLLFSEIDNDWSKTSSRGCVFSMKCEVYRATWLGSRGAAPTRCWHDLSGRWCKARNCDDRSGFIDETLAWSCLIRRAARSPNYWRIIETHVLEMERQTLVVKNASRLLGALASKSCEHLPSVR